MESKRGRRLNKVFGKFKVNTIYAVALGRRQNKAKMATRQGKKGTKKVNTYDEIPLLLLSFFVAEDFVSIFCERRRRGESEQEKLQPMRKMKTTLSWSFLTGTAE